jgi:hypothetical protein
MLTKLIVAPEGVERFAEMFAGGVRGVALPILFFVICLAHTEIIEQRGTTT